MAKCLQEGKSGKSTKLITVVFFDFPLAVSFVIELDMPLRSVSLIQESFIYGLGFNSQTLSGSLLLFELVR